MLLTITCTGENAQDLGYLLHKNPERTQRFRLSFGEAYVFYPEATQTQTTAALLLDVNPIDLARGKLGSRDGGLFDYVNDRPYVCSSFMSTAIARVFGSALSGKGGERQDKADTPLCLTSVVHMLPLRGDTSLLQEIFGPLGYEVSCVTYPLDERFPEWGESCYVDLTLRGCVTLRALLNHLYVLMPVFDRRKHYWMSADEIQKLLSHGEGWLNGHPAREMIVRRYFGTRRGYAAEAIEQLMAADGQEDAEDEAEAEEAADAGESAVENAAAEPEAAVQAPRVPLNTLRLAAVREAVLQSGAHTVADLGCGEGNLTAMLLAESQMQKVLAMDVSVRALKRAEDHLHMDRMPEWKRRKLTLIQGSLMYRDERLKGWDAACLVEVIEHVDPSRLTLLEQAVFEAAAPATVIVTTPNREYNVRYPHLQQNELRHRDHRFEWTRAEFAAWTAHVCEKYGYSVVISPVGEQDAEVGSPTQMGVLTKCA